MGHKYNAKKTEMDGITFDSKAEAHRYRDLTLLQKAGQISGLELQPAFELQEAFTDATGHRQRAIKYLADFKYTEAGQQVIEDVKGMEPPVFKLKKKLFLYRYPEYELRIVE